MLLPIFKLKLRTFSIPKMLSGSFLPKKLPKYKEKEKL